MRTDRRSLLAVLAAAALAACTPKPPTPQTPLTVFAAASLTDALTEIAGDFERETGRPVRLSFAASGAVARQIDAGAPADLVVLADRPWMDRLQASGRIQPATRSDLLGNRLVLIAAPAAQVTGDPIAWVRQSGGKLVIGDPESVPAGTYARTWLEGRGLWEAVQPSLATAADVRAVRTFVARGEAALGIVYRSDTVGAEGVKVVVEPPAAEQPSIVYPAALTTAATPGADAFLSWLKTPEADAVFRRYGFEPLA